MALTKEQAIELAGHYWPGKRVDSIVLRDDGGAHLSIEESINAHYSFHTLNAQGETTCHPGACTRQEPEHAHNRRKGD